MGEFLIIKQKESEIMDNLKKFYAALKSDEAMRDRLNAIGEKYQGAEPDKEAAMADVVAFAKSEGFELTADEIEAYFNPAGGELSEAELANVAGGGCKDSYVCGCLLGGGGSENGKTCACILGGYADFDNGWHLECYLVGDIKRSF